MKAINKDRAIIVIALFFSAFLLFISSPMHIQLIQLFVVSFFALLLFFTIPSFTLNYYTQKDTITRTYYSLLYNYSLWAVIIGVNYSTNINLIKGIVLIFIGIGATLIMVYDAKKIS